jgi:hypothetical protein
MRRCAVGGGNHDCQGVLVRRHSHVRGDLLKTEGADKGPAVETDRDGTGSWHKVADPQVSDRWGG